MGNWLRRLRGALGMGLTWGFVLSAVGTLPRWVFGIQTDAPIPLLAGVFGFFAGVSFSGVLMLAEGRRRFDQMSLPRFAGWGALGGLLLSAIFIRVVGFGWSELLVIAPTFALGSAACAAGSLALARRAVTRALPDDPARAELPGAEQRQLP